MDWKPLDKKTLEYIGTEPRCCECHKKLGDNTKAYSRSEKDGLTMCICARKVCLLWRNLGFMMYV
jgi:hypothetical protein